MDDFVGNPTPENLSSENMRWLLDFWNDLRGTREMPGRADFSPADMVPLLPYITLADVEHDPLKFKMRLVGTGIVTETGVDLTGRYLDKLRDSDGMVRRGVWVAENRQPCSAQDIPLGWASRDFDRYSILVLPLSVDGERVDMLLSLVDFN